MNKHKICSRCEHPHNRKGRICSSCEKKQEQQTDPVKYAFGVLRNNAKRRKKEFTITLAFFRQFCVDTDYMLNKGTSKHSYTIDRIDNNKGYTPDNIRVLSNVENARKNNKCVYDHVNGGFTTIEIIKPDTSTDEKYF